MDVQLIDSRLNAIMPQLNDEQRDYIDQAVALIDEAEKRGIHMRLLGSTAVLLNCPKHVRLFQSLNRVLTDIDLVAYGSQEREIERMLSDLGFNVKGGRGVTMNVFTGRRIFQPISGTKRSVDVFFDKLDFCHPIEFKGRLDLSGYYTITLSDLVLEKMQIVEINEKDLKDTIIIFLEHSLGSDEKNEINLDRITKPLGEDWGFYYTVTTNLNKVKSYSLRFDVLTEEEKARVAERIDKLLELIESKPKSLKWKLRARVGTKTRWYQEVGEGYREIGQ
jgi:hypothetical protein